MPTLSHRITNFLQCSQNSDVSETCQINICAFSTDFAISLPEAVGLIDLEEEGTMILRNVGTYLQVYTA